MGHLWAGGPSGLVESGLARVLVAARAEGQQPHPVSCEKRGRLEHLPVSILEYAAYPRSPAAALPLAWCWPILVGHGHLQSTCSCSLFRVHAVPDEIVFPSLARLLSRSLLGKYVSFDVCQAFTRAILLRERGNQQSASFHVTGKFPIDPTRCFFSCKT
jgi:hypothetical protein